MSIPLSDEQRAALAANPGPLLVRDERSGRQYVLAEEEFIAKLSADAEVAARHVEADDLAALLPAAAPALTDEQRDSLHARRGPVTVRDEHLKREFRLLDASSATALRRDAAAASVRIAIAELDAGRGVPAEVVFEELLAKRRSPAVP